MLRIANKLLKTQLQILESKNDEFRSSKNESKRCYSNPPKKMKFPCPPPKRRRKPFCSPKKCVLYALLLIIGATIGYAKYDPDFRQNLVCTAPFTDDVIKFVCQEEKTYCDSISTWFHAAKDYVCSLVCNVEETGKDKKKTPAKPKSKEKPKEKGK